MKRSNVRRLAAAVLLQAVRDAMADNPRIAAKARCWLVGEYAADWLAELGIPQKQVTIWLAGLPRLPYTFAQDVDT